MAKDSKLSVIGATLADFAIAGADLIAAIAGGSSAMLSQSVHSAVDGANDLLLLFGLTRSRRQADEQHPFGYGKELYFWALIVSCSVFAVGGAVSLFEGIQHLIRPEEMKKVAWAYGALGAGAAFDAGSFFFSLRQFRKQSGSKGFEEAAREAKDPTSLTVLVVDAAAFFSDLIAAAGVSLQSHGWKHADGSASIVIGLMMGVIAVYLMNQNRDLIVGEGVDDEIARSIRELAVGTGKFQSVRSAHTMHFGPDTVLATIEAVYDPDRPAGELMRAVDTVQHDIRKRHPAVKFIYIDPETGTKHRTGARWSDPGTHGPERA